MPSDVTPCRRDRSHRIVINDTSYSLQKHCFYYYTTPKKIVAAQSLKSLL